tara:strand:- start:733 stop:1725 length:993 start_codon:yes stop_codon:yes gene_type:complete
MDGNYTAEFEHWLAQKNHVKHGVTVHSGTNALESIAAYYFKQLYSIKPKVIVPSVTFRATANAWLMAGWDIIVADCDQYGMMDINSVKQYHNDAIAVCLVGLYGNSLKNFKTAAFEKLCNNKSWLIVEDAAQHWLSWDCKRIAPTAISFDPMKNLGNYGNGGAVVTDIKELADFVRNYRAHGKGNEEYPIGSNSRMSEIDCATMLIKSQHIDSWQLRRRDISMHWIDRLANSSARALIDSSNSAEHCYHKFVIEVDHRDHVINTLKENGIDTKVHYTQCINEMAHTPVGVTPMLSRGVSLTRRVVSLPIYPELTDLEVEYIIDQVLDCVS